MSDPHKPQDDATEQLVIDYLQAHPDLLDRHPAVLGALSIPHETGSAVSLIERQVGVLREQRDQAQDRLRELIGIAHENDRLGERMHGLVLALLGCNNLVEVIDALHHCLVGVFQAERIDLHLFSDQVRGELADGVTYLDRSEGNLGLFDHILNSRKPICGRLTGDQLDALYGDEQAAIASAAVVPLIGTQVIGLLAIGSEDADRFQHGMGTAFLQQLGELVATAMLRHLEPVAAVQADRQAD